MAIDPKPGHADPDYASLVENAGKAMLEAGKAMLEFERLDNEVPAYRALSRLAVGGLVLGIASILTFTDLNFTVFGVLSIILGIWAQRRIRKFPEMLTGEKLANAGIAVSLVFVLTAWTISLTQSWLISHAANKFADQYLTAMKTGVYEEMLFFQSLPDGRKGKAIKQVAAEMLDSPRAQREFEMVNVGLAKLGERLKNKEQVKVEYEGIYGQDLDGMQVAAALLYRVTGPKTESFPEESALARILISGLQKNNQYEWWVKSVDFPWERPKK